MDLSCFVSAHFAAFSLGWSFGCCYCDIVFLASGASTSIGNFVVVVVVVGGGGGGVVVVGIGSSASSFQHYCCCQHHYIYRCGSPVATIDMLLHPIRTSNLRAAMDSTGAAIFIAIATI